MSINRDLRIALTSAALVSSCLGRACADCIDYSVAAHWAGSWTVPAEIHALAASGEKFYAVGTGSGQGKFFTVDAIDPLRPVVVGQVTLPWNYPESIALSGPCAYVCRGVSSGIAVVDISSDAAPTVVGQIGSGAIHLRVDGNRLYVAGVNKLEIYELSNPFVPTLLGTLPWDGDLTRLAVSDGFAYVAEGAGGVSVSIVDVDPPSTPVAVGSFPMPWAVADLAIRGERLAVVSGFSWIDGSTGRVKVLDLATPSQPVVLDEVDLDAEPSHVEWTEDALWVAGGGVFSVDPSGQLVRKLFLQPGPLVAEGSRLSAASGSWCSSIAAPDGLLLPTVASVSLPDSPLAFAYDARIAVVSSSIDVRVVDLTDPDTPVTRGTYDQYFFPDNLAMLGSHVYVGTPYDGIRILSIADPDHPVEVGSLSVDRVSDLTRVGSRLYALCGEYLEVYDLTTPSAPSLIGRAYTYGNPTSMQISGDIACVAGSDFLLVLDVSSNGDPVLLGSEWCNADDVAMSGDLVFAASYFGLQVISIHDPSDPQVLETLQLGGQVTAVQELDGHILASRYSNLILLGDEGGGPLGLLGGLVGFGGSPMVATESNLLIASARAGEVTWRLEVLPLPCAPAGLEQAGQGVEGFAHLVATPNPSGGSVRIAHTGVGSEWSIIRLFDAGGREVRSWAGSTGPSGVGEVVWDGTDGNGAALPRGVYLARLESRSGNAETRVVLLGRSR